MAVLHHSSTMEGFARVTILSYAVQDLTPDWPRDGWLLGDLGITPGITGLFEERRVSRRLVKLDITLASVSLGAQNRASLPAPWTLDGSVIGHAVLVSVFLDESVAQSLDPNHGSTAAVGSPAFHKRPRVRSGQLS